MAKLDANEIIGLLHGKLGGLIFSRTQDGQIQVRRRPVRRAAFREGELTNQDTFAQAIAYVAAARQEPELYTPYQQAGKLKGKRACDLAHSDFRNPPVITDIDLSAYTGSPGQRILVQAVDDFEVVRLVVTVAKVDHEVIEIGTSAQVPETGAWRYVTQLSAAGLQVVTIHVTAFDRPGNAVTRSVDHALF